MKTHTYTMEDLKISLPVCYELMENMPGDPENSLPFLAETEDAECTVIAFMIDQEDSLPRDKEELISGIRDCLSDKQGIIEVEVGENYAYSIVKTLLNQVDIQYGLTFQRWTSDNARVLNVHAFFNNRGTTGVREAIVYELCRSDGTITDGLDGWMRDPYTGESHGVATMNISEDRKYDKQFETFPLSMCRELVEVLKS